MLAIIGLVTIYAVIIIYALITLFFLLLQIVGPGKFKASHFLMTIAWPIALPIFYLVVGKDE